MGAKSKEFLCLHENLTLCQFLALIPGSKKKPHKSEISVVKFHIACGKNDPCQIRCIWSGRMYSRHSNLTCKKASLPNSTLKLALPGGFSIFIFQLLKPKPQSPRLFCATPHLIGYTLKMNIQNRTLLQCPWFKPLSCLA